MTTPGEARSVLAAIAVATVVFFALLAGNVMFVQPDRAQQQQYDPAPAETVDEEVALEFEDVASEAGIEYVADDVYRPLVRSAVYVSDVDSDGYEDLLAMGGGPTLFVNTGGEYEKHRTFDVERPRAALFLDYDNDGTQDLLFLGWGTEPVLYENRGGTFDRVDAGFDDATMRPWGATAADFTGNGCPDVFVYQIGPWGFTKPIDRGTAKAVMQNHPEVRPEANRAHENKLYAGNCEGFEEVTDEAGIRGEAWTNAASAADFTGDDRPDIHVANDFTHDVLYVNRGDGRFERRDMGPKTDRNAMSSEVVDLTGNHELDLFVTNIWYNDSRMDSRIFGKSLTLGPVPEGNNLLINDGTGNFTDRADEYDVQRGGFGWAAVFADFTNSGGQDLAHGTRPLEPAVTPYDQYGVIQLWTQSDGTFHRLDGRDRGFERQQVFGLVTTDYDADGTLDLVAAPTPESVLAPDDFDQFQLYQNQIDSTDALQLFVRNPDGMELNAEVYVETAGGETIYRVVNSKAGWASQDSRMVHVGTENRSIESVRVEWPDGTESTYADLDSGARYILTPDGAELVTTFESAQP